MNNRKNPQTSIDAFKSLEADKLNERYKKILDALATIGEGTFEEIAVAAKLDKSIVWKRLGELATKQLIFRPGRKRLLKSNRSGFTWMLTNGATPKTTEQENVFRTTKPTFTDHTRKLNQVTAPTLFP